MKRRQAVFVVLLVVAVPTACESRTPGDSPSVTVSSPGAYGRPGTVRVLEKGRRPRT